MEKSPTRSDMEFFVECYPQASRLPANFVPEKGVNKGAYTRYAIRTQAMFGMYRIEKTEWIKAGRKFLDNMQ